MSDFINVWELKDGTYKAPCDVYIYKKANRVLYMITNTTSPGNTIQIVEKGDVRLVSRPTPCSYNEVYDVYRRILGYSDEILGVRGILIKPDELDKRVYIDELERMYLKY